MSKKSNSVFVGVKGSPEVEKFIAEKFGKEHTEQGKKEIMEKQAIALQENKGIFSQAVIEIAEQLGNNEKWIDTVRGLVEKHGINAKNWKAFVKELKPVAMIHYKSDESFRRTMTYLKEQLGFKAKSKPSGVDFIKMLENAVQGLSETMAGNDILGMVEDLIEEVQDDMTPAEEAEQAKEAEEAKALIA